MVVPEHPAILRLAQTEVDEHQMTLDDRLGRVDEDFLANQGMAPGLGADLVPCIHRLRSWHGILKRRAKLI